MVGQINLLSILELVYFFKIEQLGFKIEQLGFKIEQLGFKIEQLSFQKKESVLTSV